MDYTKMDCIQTVAKTMMNYDNPKTLGFKAEYIPPSKKSDGHWKLSRLMTSNYQFGNKKWEVI